MPEGTVWYTGGLLFLQLPLYCRLLLLLMCEDACLCLLVDASVLGVSSAFCWPWVR